MDECQHAAFLKSIFCIMNVVGDSLDLSEEPGTMALEKLNEGCMISGPGHRNQ